MSTIVEKFFEETLDAINRLIEQKNYYVSVKKVREILGISSQNRSRINFTWRFLKKLRKARYLSLSHVNSAKSYKIRSKNKIHMDPKVFLEQY